MCAGSVVECQLVFFRVTIHARRTVHQRFSSFDQDGISDVGTLPAPAVLQEYGCHLRFTG